MIIASKVFKIWGQNTWVSALFKDWISSDKAMIAEVFNSFESELKNQLKSTDSTKIYLGPSHADTDPIVKSFLSASAHAKKSIPLKKRKNTDLFFVSNYKSDLIVKKTNWLKLTVENKKSEHSLIKIKDNLGLFHLDDFDKSAQISLITEQPFLPVLSFDNETPQRLSSMIEMTHLKTSSFSAHMRVSKKA